MIREVRDAPRPVQHCARFETPDAAESRPIRARVAERQMLLDRVKIRLARGPPGWAQSALISLAKRIEPGLGSA